MELLNRRISSGDEATLGTLFDVTEEEKPKFLCYVLEDQFNEPKIPGETRIPPGRYQVKLRTDGGMNNRYGKRFDWHKGMLWLQDVPGFTFIYMHVGNKDDDSEGCLLLGDGQMQNVTERGQVTSSVSAYRRIYEYIVERLDLIEEMALDEEVWITVEDYA
jgi:hypothetical protein